MKPMLPTKPPSLSSEASLRKEFETKCARRSWLFLQPQTYNKPVRRDDDDCRLVNTVFNPDELAVKKTLQ